MADLGFDVNFKSTDLGEIYVGVKTSVIIKIVILGDCDEW